MTTKVIHEANLAEVKELSSTSAEFVIRPLYYGYGNTLGNSLRRVLLSSIKGAAITSFSIEGATHEFTTVKGIREDVVDIMLNLKIEKSSEERIHSDMIALDAVFTPVLRVRYKVENTRVGQDINLQQLNLVIDTDGTITPKEAFEEAAAILVNQYSALAGSTTVESAPAPGTTEEQEDSGLALPIEELGLSARTANALINNNIKTVRDLVVLSDSDLKDLKGFGTKALDEVKEKLTELNI